MLRVTTLYASSAAATASYYTKYLTQAPGEVAGVWAGKQAIALGLGGEASSDALQALLEGRDPVRATPLGYPLKDRTLSDGRVVRAVAGFDATFSAPKSVSVLWALTHDDRLLDAHDAAVTAALSHLELYGSTTRVRADGRRLHPDSHGLTIATFRQTTSRADDPQLHTHAVVSAKVQTLDGRWLALDARYLKRHQRMLGGLYQSALRSELTHRFDVAWGPIINGQSEIAGVPPELLDTFSKRSSQVDAALAAKLVEFHSREGRDPTRWERAALTREAAADTRDHKTGNGVADLWKRWAEEAEAVGWTPATVLDTVKQVGRELHAEPVPRVTIAQAVEALSVAGSTWTRADIMRVLCDAQRPLAGNTAEQWAKTLERACDAVIGGCVELDPVDTAAPRRASDGRSMWLEPTAPHITSEAVLAEEEYVLSWAIDAQAAEPWPSTTIVVGELDVLQSDVAAAVAGNDRLVLSVGPAGTGKTTTLRAARSDLAQQAREVLGVAPSAKAARVLERETGIASDTLAKLLHEWERTDRAPHDRYRLPAGTTVIVDEAGMVGTGALARLVAMASRHEWRLALIGDPRQLQAVGRGGLFHELCMTGRCHELNRIHRFVEPWEAAASLQLRRGDPRGLGAYFEHDRVIADTFDNQLARIADMWLTTTARNGTAAITTSTNEHVDAINAVVQAARREVGQIDDTASTAIGGRERASVGDVVVTRRNDRRLVTTRGEPVRNRELWTVTDVHGDSTLTVSSHLGSGGVRLPSDYVRQHVRLGYAATEHGNQSDTVTIGAELVTPATTRRGLYVGVTRGHEQNLMLVVTEDRDLDQARDILECVLASDRVDVPATTQRRELAAADRAPQRRQPATQPRCVVPAWFEPLQKRVQDEIAENKQRAADDARRVPELQASLVAASERLAEAKRALAPHAPERSTAHEAVQAAREQWWAANNREMRSTGRKRRSAHRDVITTKRLLENAVAHQTRVEEIVKPVVSAYATAIDDVRNIEQLITPTRQLLSWSDHEGQAHRLREVDEALADWRGWAQGERVPTARLHTIVQTLVEHPGHNLELCNALADALISWGTAARIDLAPRPPQRHVPDRGLEIGL